MENLPKFGFGGYRVDNRVSEHFNALTKAILNGITLIDTSTNYSEGGSEILIGNVVNDLTGSGKIKREKSGRSHILTKKSPKRKRQLATATLVSKGDEGRVKRMILAE